MNTADLEIEKNHLKPGAELTEVTSLHSNGHSSHLQVRETQEKSAEDEAKEAEEERLKKPFRLFTIDSLKLLELRELEEKLKAEKGNEEDEGKLVDGEIVFDEDQDKPKQDQNPRLAEGQSLPERFGRFPRDLLGVPIEELDECIKVKSFVAIAKKFSKHSIFRFSAAKSLFIFSPFHPLRRLCIKIVTNQWFDLLILFATIVFCCTMTVKPGTGTVLEEAFQYLEYIFQGIYCVEMFVKIISKGFILNKYTYLRDPWNWLDFVVILLGFLTITLDNLKLDIGNLSGIRALRIFRALKGVSVVPGLRTIVNTLLNSFVRLFEVMILTMFVLAVFSLFALQFFMGRFRQKCILDMPNTYNFCNGTVIANTSTPCFQSESDFVNYWLQDRNNWYMTDSGSYLICGFVPGSISCPIGTFCHATGDNPSDGFTQFDDFGYALLNCFQAITGDQWEEIYNTVTDSSGPWNMLFFILIVLLGTYYLMNLMLAVVSMSYEIEVEQAAKLAEEEEEEERKKAARTENTAMMFDAKKIRQQLAQRQKEQEEKQRLAEGGTPLPAITEKVQVEDETKVQVTLGNGKSESNPSKRPITAKGEFIKTPFNVQSPVYDSFVEMKDVGDEDKYGKKMSSPTKTVTSEVTASKINPEYSSDNTLTITSYAKLTEDPEKGPGDEDEDEDEFHDDLPDINPRQRRYLVQKYATLWMNKIRPDDEHLVDRNCLCCARPGLSIYHQWLKFQARVFKVANHGFFELFITLCIVFNTIVMAYDHYDQCELCRFCPDFNVTTTIYGSNLSDCQLCPSTVCGQVDITQYSSESDGMTISEVNFMSKANVVFTLIFTVEAVIKLIALSKDYFKNPWNGFDLFIVMFSIPDIILYFANLENVPGLSSVSSIVKVFRLLRILKLAQAWNTMKTLIMIVFQTLAALINVVVVLFAIIFIFAVLGFQLLGDSYNDFNTKPELGGMPRWNFHTFGNSLLMIVRVLCGEWTDPMRQCSLVIDRTGCLLFFIFVLIIGNFLVWNLFLALLLNAFTTDNIAGNQSNEESKMVRAVKDLISYCRNRNKTSRTITPSSDPSGSQVSIVSRSSHRRTRLDDILDRGQTGKSILSIKNHIQASESHKGATLGADLKPMANGHSNSGLNGSAVSMISTGNGVSNGGLKHSNTSNMSPENVLHAENAFNLNRSEYASFEGSMNANSPKHKVVIEESKNNVMTLDSDTKEDDKNETIPDQTKQKEEEENADEKLVDADGTVNLPDCLCAVCHKNPKLNDCCCFVWTTNRELWARIISNPVFEGFILFLIFLSSLTLCFEDNTLHENPELKQALDYMNVTFTVLFTLEMLTKWLALGLKKYFTNSWTVLDFIIVSVSLVDMVGSAAGLNGLSVFKILRILRAFRPLRAVSRWQNMKIVVNALFYAMPSIGNVAVVICVLWLIFAIAGVQNLKGRYFACFYNDEKVPASTTPELTSWACGDDSVRVENFSLETYRFDSFNGNDWNYTIHKWPSSLGDNCKNNSVLKELTWPGLCARLGGSWEQPLVHYDSLLTAYLCLFQLATFEGWQEILGAAIDSPENLGDQAFFEARTNMYFYFVFFILIGSFLSINMFIGVIVENFNNLKKKYDGSYLAAFLTENQRHYYSTLKKLGNKKPQKTIRRPKNAFQAFFFDIASNSKFDMAILAVILANMVVMMLDYMPAPQYDVGKLLNGSYVLTEENAKVHATQELINYITDKINTAFTMVFLLEAIIKLIGLRWHYFRNAWNVFDFIVMVLSLAGILIDLLASGITFLSPTMFRVVRVFRIGRVLRLIKAAKGLRKLLFALIISMPALFNIAILLFIIMSIYAIVGMSLFGNVRHIDPFSPTINFSSFGSSIRLLFRLATVSGWNDILYVIMDEGNCNKNFYTDTLGVLQSGSLLPGDCGNQAAACVYLTSYLILSFMMIINMYIAVILENFKNAHEQEEIGITEDDFDMFYMTWEKYDPLAIQYIKIEDLSDFLAELEDPFSLPKPNGMSIVAFNLPIVEGERVHCLDVLMALVKRTLHAVEEVSHDSSKEHKMASEQLRQQIADSYKSAFPQREKAKIISTTMQRKKEDVAAKTLQRAWRRHRMQKNILKLRELVKDHNLRESFSRKLSETIGSIKSRISSAVSRLSRRASIKSNDSHIIPPAGQLNSNRLAPYAPRKKDYGYS